MQHRFQNLPSLCIPTPTSGKKKKKTKHQKTPTQTTPPTQLATTKHYRSLLGQSFCTALSRMTLFPKWPVKKHNKTKPKRKEDTEA